MSLQQTQARDGLLFAFGVATYYDGRTQVPADRLARVLRAGATDVHDEASRVGRLPGIALRIRHFGSAAHSILIVHAATLLPVLVVVALLIDWIDDGALDLLQMLF